MGTEFEPTANQARRETTRSVPTNVFEMVRDTWIGNWVAFEAIMEMACWIGMWFGHLGC